MRCEQLSETRLQKPEAQEAYLASVKGAQAPSPPPPPPPSSSPQDHGLPVQFWMTMKVYSVTVTQIISVPSFVLMRTFASSLSAGPFRSSFRHFLQLFTKSESSAAYM